MSDLTPKYTNSLVRETSPYLLQHAHNPVDWLPWTREVLVKAKQEDKIILVSIGYSSCHWCHVMEKESFEDEGVAAIMNKHFVCIKVDREERPDVDQLYMNAAQLITRNAGWPLNCFATPDGRPIYAGTYFPRENWISVLQKVADEWENNRSKLEDYANRLLEALKDNSKVEPLKGFTMTGSRVQQVMDETILTWQNSFDRENGGREGAPKFPMPNNWLFLLRWAHIYENQPVKDFALHTVRQISMGGIYDQIGGGLSRYAVDAHWRVPHFEKMLYDNAQFLEVLADAYWVSKENHFKDVMLQTIAYLNAEMKDGSGLYYSAYDADSEGVEGKYYVWTEDELKGILDEDFSVLTDVYHIDSKGHWEDGNYVLMRKKTDEELAEAWQVDSVTASTRVKTINQKLVDHRSNRVEPGLDDKCLTSWNALLVSGLFRAGEALQSQDIVANANDLLQTLLDIQLSENKLWHTYKGGVSTISGFLDDYTFLIRALLDGYRVNQDVELLKLADRLTKHVIAQFFDEDQSMFTYTARDNNELITPQIETTDNVIPSSNSMMCRNLLELAKLMNNMQYRAIAMDMIDRMVPRFKSYPAGFSNWMLAVLEAFDTAKELVVVGDHSEAWRDYTLSTYLPFVTKVFSKTETLPITEGRLVQGKTLGYLCTGNVCHQSVDSVESLLDSI